MPRTYFHDFVRDNGLPVTVEYSASGGEPNFDYPGHICDGGGSGPEIVIVAVWPNTPWHEWLAKWALWGRMRFLPNLLMRIDEWWRASLTDTERERMEQWLAENYVDEPYEPDDWR